MKEIHGIRLKGREIFYKRVEALAPTALPIMRSCYDSLDEKFGTTSRTRAYSTWAKNILDPSQQRNTTPQVINTYIENFCHFLLIHADQFDNDFDAYKNFCRISRSFYSNFGLFLNKEIIDQFSVNWVDLVNNESMFLSLPADWQVDLIISQENVAKENVGGEKE